MDFLHWLILLGIYGIALGTAGHALMYKRDPRSALTWIAISLAIPPVGSLLYFLLGINRVRTKAQKEKQRAPLTIWGQGLTFGSPSGHNPWDALAPQYREIARMADALTRWPLTDCNAIDILHNGETAFPTMLEAIRGANSSVYLSSYIFESNTTGREFIEALGQASRRGVDVRVIIDGIGDLYSWPRASRLLAKHGVPVARFLPPKLLPPSMIINLRNHRKILAVDGTIAFAGGMNIGDRHLAADQNNPHRVVDIHFQFQGPIVSQIEEAFLEDWGFAANETAPPPSKPHRCAHGQALCRTVIDGPSKEMDKLPMILVGAIAAARHSIALMTPYFLPPQQIIAALQAAALRGVEVQILLPEQNNLPYMRWATDNMLWELLQHGVDVAYQPPPFVHSKFFVVDEDFALVGSPNIDPRSLRLNFELAIEVYDVAFARQLLAHFHAIRNTSRPVSLEEVDARPLPIRIRDSLSWLFSPYL